MLSYALRIDGARLFIETKLNDEKCALHHNLLVMNGATASNQDAREASVALREFQDSSGIEWKVWDTTPERMHASPASDRALGELRSGWITFSSILGRRRLAPVPAGWANLPSQELEKLCERAVPTKRHSGEVTPADELQAVNPNIPPRRATD